MSSSSRANRLAAVFGAVSVLAIPAAVAASRFVPGARLLESLYAAVAVACLFGTAAVAAVRRGRFNAQRTVHPEAARPTRLVRGLAFLGLYLGVTGALALAVYAALRFAQ